MALPLPLLGVGVGALTDDSDQGIQGGPTENASNWIAAVKAALPQYATRPNLRFEQMTNYLCQESQKGNTAAEALWGMALIGQSHTSEESTNGLQLLQDSAEKGYAPAMVYLGEIYENGQYIPTNYDLAFHWLSWAAAAGDADGELQLGGCYFYGLGTTQDLAKTVQLNRLAAAQTNYVAMKSLGYELMNALGTPKDMDAATYWLTRAAKEGGNRRAMLNLGSIYEAKFPDTNAMTQAFQWYQQSAELGDALGCYELAECYRYGWGTETNVTRYREWIYNAARLGATEAQYEMGLAYQMGDGVPMDMETALIWYRKAAAKNDPSALYNMGMYYLKIIEHPQYRQAYDYLVRSAEAGNRAAQYECAIITFVGDIGPPDFEKGKQWLTESANNGWNPAEFNLFSFYYNGIPPAAGLPNFPQDKTEAVKWLRRAAENGNFLAQSTLAVMLIQGIGMEQDTAEADKWLRNAAEHGYAQAQNDLGFAILHGDIDSADPLEAATWCQLAKAHWTNPKTQHIIDANLSGALSQLTQSQQSEVAQRVKNFQPLPIPSPNPLVKGWNKYPTYQQEDGRFGH
jgi:TPR repeat protein